jgi:type IV secretion system protein VirD4
MTIGATGAGKTAGPAISNALTHPGQLVVTECSGYVYAATFERRKAIGQEVILLDLREMNPASGAFNPIDAAKFCGGGNDVIARSLAAAAVTRSKHEEVFWSNWGETMISSGLALKLETCPPHEHTFAALFDLFNTDDVTYSLAVQLDTFKKLSRAAHSGIAGYLQLSERETRPSVLGSTQQHLRLWESDLIRKLTSSTTFDLQALVDGAPMSIYLIAPPLRLKAYAHIIRLWLNALLSVLMTRRSKPRHRTLMLCDEMGALGEFDAFVVASTLMRSSGLQFWSFWQNASQLEVYGHHAKTLIDNVGVLQLLGARNRRMAQEFADLVGGVSADEIMGMGDDECLALIGGHRVEWMRKIRFFEHPQLRNLAHAPAAHQR